MMLQRDGGVGEEELSSRRKRGADGQLEAIACFITKGGLMWSQFFAIIAELAR